jgi:hypothetical protein
MKTFNHGWTRINADSEITIRLWREMSDRLNSIYARPHPGPLPRGEGETLARSREIEYRLAQSCPGGAWDSVPEFLNVTDKTCVESHGQDARATTESADGWFGVYARPHPGPLPRGEGETLAGSWIFSTIFDSIQRKEFMGGWSLLTSAAARSDVPLTCQTVVE